MEGIGQKRVYIGGVGGDDGELNIGDKSFMRLSGKRNRRIEERNVLCYKEVKDR